MTQFLNNYRYTALPKSNVTILFTRALFIFSALAVYVGGGCYDDSRN
jgi:hypothetical protein